VGSAVDGVWMASTSDYKFTKKSEMAVTCLNSQSDGLWACSNEGAKPVGFIAGLSTDDGANFEPKQHFCDIRGALSCSAESTTSRTCKWPVQRDLLGCDPNYNGRDPDGGFVNEAGGFSSSGNDGNGATNTTKTSGCDCQSVLGSEGSAGGAAATIVAALAALARRRRKK